MGVIKSRYQYCGEKTLNKNRAALGMSPIADVAKHLPSNAFNYLMYSPSLGSVDPDWPYKWAIGGYIFNDDMPYDADIYRNFTEFIEKDNKKTIFYTFGSCNSADHEHFAEKLFTVCKTHGYKLVIGSGWCKLGSTLPRHDDLLLLDTTIPHNLIFPRCSAIIHHGGAGTTHNATRFGKPQMIQSLLADQWYWAERTKKLGVGPGMIDMKKCGDTQLEKKTP